MFSPGGNRIPFETHLERLQEPARAIIVDLRKFAMSLGSNVIEEVRPHRVVYAKTMNFRIFLDVEPAGDALVIAIKASRNMAPFTAEIKTAQDAESIKKQIAEAYQKIQ